MKDIMNIGSVCNLPCVMTVIFIKGRLWEAEGIERRCRC